MHKKAAVFIFTLIVALPAGVSAYYIDKGCTHGITDLSTGAGGWSGEGCTAERLVQLGTDPALKLVERIDALLAVVMILQDKLKVLQQVSTAPKGCLDLTKDLYMGRSDADTGGEVSKLQLWLKAQGYFPDAQGTGYYGDKTAAAVMKWQKAHGMDFVNLKSGVGKQTRAKMKCSNSGLPEITKVSWRIESANPAATDSYKKDEQRIFIDVIRADNSIRGYDLGTAFGCSVSTHVPELNDKIALGYLNCYYALSGTTFFAYTQNGKFIVEKGVESARDGSVAKTVLLEL